MRSHLTLHQSFLVPFSYPVNFCRRAFTDGSGVWDGVFDPTEGRPRMFAVIDSGVVEAFPDLADRVAAWASGRVELVCSPVTVPGGETLKNDYRKLMTVMDQMLEHHLCRHSYVLAIGGGALLDAAGLATALLHRGLRLIRMPSTTLAQNDAGIGVKNGMNLHGGKNTIGTFAPPWAVINDFDLLDGLCDSRWRDGIAEAFKVALIKDADFHRELIGMSPALGRRDAAAMERLIVRCAELHLAHIATSGDPFETGSARPLDFGHWSAHKLESISNYHLSHGQAVAVGMALDTRIAARRGWVPEQTAAELASALRTCGFDLHPPELTRRLGDGSLQLLQGLEEFREHLGGQLTLALPGPVGAVRETHHLEPDEIEEAVAYLAATACA